MPESIRMLRGAQAFLLANGDCFEGDAVAKLARPEAQPTDCDVVLLSLDDEPGWAVEIMRETFDLPFVPCLAWIRRNRVGLVRGRSSRDDRPGSRGVG